MRLTMGQRTLVHNAVARIRATHTPDPSGWVRGILGDDATDRDVVSWVVAHYTNQQQVLADLRRLGGRIDTTLVRQRTLMVVAATWPELGSAARRMAAELDPDTFVDEAIDQLVVFKVLDPEGEAIAWDQAERASRGQRPWARHTLPRSYVNRLVVNFIRHQHSNYDKVLADLSDAIGMGHEAPVQVRVYELIAEMYPRYGHECERQSKERVGA